MEERSIFLVLRVTEISEGKNLKMHVFIVYAHPSKESFTHTVLETFVAGLKESGNTYEISDLYCMNFKADMDLEEYIRESGKEINRSIPGDVRQGTELIQDINSKKKKH